MSKIAPYQFHIALIITGHVLQVHVQYVAQRVYLYGGIQYSVTNIKNVLDVLDETHYCQMKHWREGGHKRDCKRLQKSTKRKRKQEEEDSTCSRYTLFCVLRKDRTLSPTHPWHHLFHTIRLQVNN